MIRIHCCPFYFQLKLCVESETTVSVAVAEDTESDKWIVGNVINSIWRQFAKLNLGAVATVTFTVRIFKISPSFFLATFFKRLQNKNNSSKHEMRKNLLASILLACSA